MAEPTPQAKLTYGDLLALPEDGRRHELIAGRHFVTPSPVTRHQAVLVNLLIAICNHLERHDLGAVYPAPLDVVLSDHDVVEPDLLFVRRERASIVTETHLAGAPDLVVEILSPGTRARDLGAKRKLYELAGVGEYWIVDPDVETVQVLIRGDDGGFEAARELSREAGDRLLTELLPGLEVPLEKIFR